ncbi:hypothetical protein CDAR_78931 [Caerostris darwini]|uniref:Uncharacterized protein n=1 Tax=Caerostris darwini TaxID=1538125 RepID=A0AAV4Q132_9ARAC|nr:hypothetical protein CDAR_78931 [Caerostris darwini]
MEPWKMASGTLKETNEVLVEERKTVSVRGLRQLGNVTVRRPIIPAAVWQMCIKAPLTALGHKGRCGVSVPAPFVCPKWVRTALPVSGSSDTSHLGQWDRESGEAHPRS